MKKIILFVGLSGIVIFITTAINGGTFDALICAIDPGFSYTSKNQTLGDIYNCISKGGKWGIAGMSGCRCFNKAKDVNKPCSSWEKDCEGLCLAPKNAKEGEKVVGKCSKYDLMFGCHSLVEDGKAVSICSD